MAFDQQCAQERKKPTEGKTFSQVSVRMTHTLTAAKTKNE